MNDCNINYNSMNDYRKKNNVDYEVINPIQGYSKNSLTEPQILNNVPTIRIK